ncbi:unnamed protein product, partial [Prorocentrum cordatum]
VRQDRLRKRRTTDGARTIGALKSKAKMAVISEETDDSDMKANWDMPADPWVDGSLRGLDLSEETMGPVELELFYEGNFLLAPGPKRGLQGKCIHPMEARKRGGKQYGTFVHCAICKERLTMHRKSKKEIEEARQVKKEERELAARVVKELKKEMTEPRESSFPPFARKAEPVDWLGRRLRVKAAVKTGSPVKVDQDAPIEADRQSVQEQIEELRQTMVQQQNTGLNGQLSELTGLLRALVAGQAGGSGGGRPPRGTEGEPARANEDGARSSPLGTGGLQHEASAALPQNRPEPSVLKSTIFALSDLPLGDQIAGGLPGAGAAGSWTGKGLRVLGGARIRVEEGKQQEGGRETIELVDTLWTSTSAVELAQALAGRGSEHLKISTRTRSGPREVSAAFITETDEDILEKTGVPASSLCESRAVFDRSRLPGE